MGIWDAIANAAGCIKGFLPGFPFSVSDPKKKNRIAGNTWKLLKGRFRGLLLRLRNAKEAIGGAMAKAAGDIKGFLSDLFLKMNILFSSVLNNISAVVYDLVKIACNTWKLLTDLLRGLLLRLRKAKEAMRNWGGAMVNTEGDIKGFLLGLFLKMKILFSSVLNNIRDAVSDPVIKIAGTTWKLLNDLLRGLLLRLTKAKEAMGNRAGDIKGFLLVLFLKIHSQHYSRLRIRSRYQGSDRHFLEHGTLGFTGWFLLCIILIVFFSVRCYK